jgi:hypothetical protein
MLTREGFWADVDAVACALIERERLTCKEVFNILRERSRFRDVAYMAALRPTFDDVTLYLINRELRRPPWMLSQLAKIAPTSSGHQLEQEPTAGAVPVPLASTR